MHFLKLFALLLVIVGGINWLLVGVLQFDLVAAVTGSEFGEVNPVSTIVYALVGAAALVPYSSLKRMLWQGKTSREIGLHFRVSREPVEYRMKVTHLWREFKDSAADS